MNINKNLFKLSIIWAISAAVLGTLIWSLTTSTLMPLVEGESINQNIIHLVYSLIITFSVGGFIALISIIPYTIIFCGFIKLVAKKPNIDASIIKVIGTSLFLSLPLILVIFFYNISAINGLSPLLWVLVSAWSGILMPRFIISALKPQKIEVAS